MAIKLELCKDLESALLGAQTILKKDPTQKKALIEELRGFREAISDEYLKQIEQEYEKSVKYAADVDHAKARRAPIPAPSDPTLSILSNQIMQDLCEIRNSLSVRGELPDMERAQHLSRKVEIYNDYESGKLAPTPTPTLSERFKEFLGTFSAALSNGRKNSSTPTQPQPPEATRSFISTVICSISNLFTKTPAAQATQTQTLAKDSEDETTRNTNSNH